MSYPDYNPYAEGHVKPTVFTNNGLLVWEVVRTDPEVVRYLEVRGFTYGRYRRYGDNKWIIGWVREEETQWPL